LFSIVAVKTLTFHKVVQRSDTLELYGGIFGDSIIKKFFIQIQRVK